MHPVELTPEELRALITLVGTFRRQALSLWGRDDKDKKAYERAVLADNLMVKLLRAE